MSNVVSVSFPTILSFKDAGYGTFFFVASLVLMLVVKPPAAYLAWSDAQIGSSSYET